MGVLFTLLFIAAIVGFFKPYIAGAARWHFGLAAFVFLILIGVTGDTKPSQSGPGSDASDSADQATASSAAEATEPAEVAGKWE